MTSDRELFFGLIGILLLLSIGIIAILARKLMKLKADESTLRHEYETQDERVQQLQIQNRFYALSSKIEALYTLDMAPALLLKSAMELLGRFEAFSALWVGMKDENGKVRPVYVTDNTEPPFLTDRYGVDYIASEQEARNPSEYAFATAEPHLFEQLEDAPMQKQCYQRARYSPLSSVISLPLFYPGHTLPDGVLTIFTNQHFEKNHPILKQLTALIRQLMIVLQRYETDAALKSEVRTLRSGTETYRNLLAAIPLRIYWKDTDLLYRGCNALFAKDIGAADCQGIIGKTERMLTDSADAELMDKRDREVLESGKEQLDQLEHSGDMWRLFSRTPLKNDRGRIVGIVGSYLDFTLFQRTLSFHEANEQRFRELLDQMPTIAIQGFDAKGRINYWNKQSERLYGYKAREAKGKKIDELLLSENARKAFSNGLLNWLHHNESMPPVTQTVYTKDKRPVPVHSARILLGRDSDSPQFYTMDIDLSRQKNAEEKLKRLADFDALTLLPNRHHLNRHLRTLITKASREHTKFAIFFIDLDNFKYINDTFGHNYGDELLVEAANRLKAVLREYDFIARFGGDEFIVTIEYGDDSFVTSHIAQKMIQTLQKAFMIKEKELYVSASIGISFFPENGEDIDLLLKQADTAMYKAKNSGKNQFAYFTEELNTTITNQLEMEYALREALREDKLIFYYQPQVDLATHDIVSCEALVRWFDEKTQQFIEPDTFLPLLEKAHLMDQLTRKAIDNALSLLEQWRRLEIEPVRIDINLPAKQLENNDIYDYMRQQLETYRIDADALGIEITETQLIESGSDISLQTLQRFSQLGIHISIDDFGTGYSSLSYLTRLDVDTVKIDKSFIMAHENTQNNALIRSIIALSHELDYQVIAEGVETRAQANLLRHYKCDKAQGNYFFRPLHPEAITERLFSDSKKKTRLDDKTNF